MNNLGCFTTYLVNVLTKVMLTLSLLSALFLREQNEPVLLENTSNLTQMFLYDNFNEKILLNYIMYILKVYQYFNYSIFN